MSAEIPSETIIRKIEANKIAMEIQMDLQLNHEIKLAASNGESSAADTAFEMRMMEICKKNIHNHKSVIDYLCKQLHARNVPGY